MSHLTKYYTTHRFSGFNHTGEAVYVDDIPSPLNCLHGAFICSTKPLARVKGIRLKSEKDVNSLVTFQDIPQGGNNIGADALFGPEPLFANELTECTGQRIAFAVFYFSEKFHIVFS